MPVKDRENDYIKRELENINKEFKDIGINLDSLRIRFNELGMVIKNRIEEDSNNVS